MNILRYKQQAQGWMFREDSSDGSDQHFFNYTAPTITGDTTQNVPSDYGGKNSGFDPNTPNLDPEYKTPSNNADPTNYTPTYNNDPSLQQVAPDQFQKLNELSDMFKKLGPIGSEYKNEAVIGQDKFLQDNYNTYGDTTPSVWKRLGITPGFSFDKETKAQRDDRMGIIGNTIGTIGNALINAVMPAPIRAGLGLYGAYRGYQADPNKDVGNAVAKGAIGLGGYFGAAGNAYLGNYGSAVAGGLAKSGVDTNLANIAGLGTDYGTGKDVNKPLSMMAGQYVGNQLGGPVGGVFGQNIGKSLASIYGKK